MRTELRGDFSRQIRSLYHLGVVGGLSDGELVDRFLSYQGEAAELAFSALVERHGSMVLHVCRSILLDEHDAQDAFQATFLVLVQRAGAVRKRDSLASWLHGVAIRVASGSRGELIRRRARERKAFEARILNEEPVEPDLELFSTLHRELARLPERYRAAVVLCYLEGRTCEEAARELGWPVGTVKSRLSRGRGRLHERLTRLGYHSASLMILPALRGPQVGSIAGLAHQFHCDKFATASLSPAVSALVHGVSRMMWLQKSGMVAIALLAIAIGGAGIRGFASRAVAQDPPRAKSNLPATSIVPARVKEKILAGTVIGPDDKPSSGAEVFLVDGHARYTANGELVGRVPGKPFRFPEKVVRGRGLTDQAGRFRFQVAGESIGEKYRLLLWVYKPGEKVAWAEVTPRSIEADEPIAVRLEARSKVRFTVLDPDQKPVEAVRIVPTFLMNGRVSIPDPIKELVARTTDRDGIASIDAFDSDFITVVRTYSDRFGMQQWDHEKIAAGLDRKVVNLVAAGSLAGRVIDAVGKPLPGSKLMIVTIPMGLSGPYVGIVDVTADPAGRFLIPALPAGKLIIRFPSENAEVNDYYYPLEDFKIEGGVASEIVIDRSKALPSKLH